MADPQVRRQVVATVDRRTTLICLDANGKTAAPYDAFGDDGIPEDAWFHTLAGDFLSPPFHVHCRSVVIPWLPGFGDEAARESRDELESRSPKAREAKWMPPPDSGNPPRG